MLLTHSYLMICFRCLMQMIWNFGKKSVNGKILTTTSQRNISEFTLQREIGGTIYTITGSYDGTETLDRKMERILTEKFTENTEDDE